MSALLTYSLPISLFLLVVLRLVSASRQPRVDFIPAIGPSGTFSSYFGAIKFFWNAQKMLQEGYDKYQGEMFRVPTLRHWQVIVTGPKLLDELRNAKEDDLSFNDAVNELFQIEHTISPRIIKNSYHVSVVRTALTRNVGARFPDVHDEIIHAFEDVITPLKTGWVKVPALKAAQQIVCRASNRLLVGLPLCRDPDYINLNIEFTLSVVTASLVINMFPKFMRPLVGRLVSSLPASARRGMRHLGPMIEERLKMEEEHGSEWPDKPNDLISWLIEAAEGDERLGHNLMMRVLAINFVAIHTTSMTFTHALYDLASHPEYIQPMREEVEAIVKQDGWTKASVDRMRKVDSFLRESQRLTGIDSAVAHRRLRRDYTFCNGTTLPAGANVAVASFSIHHDESHYPNPFEFQPFRFSDARQVAGEGLKHQMVSTGPDNLSFGLGRHACPGRFFAANELKTMFAHLLLTYDVKFDNEGVRPPNQTMETINFPNHSAEVMFRKREI